jgi:hypothetical protein
VPLDPALPPSYKAMLDDIRRRLSSLERSPRLTSASIRGGLLRVLDAAGKTVIRMGQANDRTVFQAFRADGSTALWVGRTNTGNEFFSIVDKGNRIVVSDDAVTGGLATPWVPVSFAPTKAPSASLADQGFVFLEDTDPGEGDVYRVSFSHQHPKLLVDAALFAAGSTSARLEVRDEDGDVLLSATASNSQTVGVHSVISAEDLNSTARLHSWREFTVRLFRTSGTGRVGARLDAVVGRQS